MPTSKSFKHIPPRRRFAAAAVALLCSLSVMSAVFVAFASASGELDPLLAKLKPASAAASEVASRAPPRRSRS